VNRNAPELEKLEQERRKGRPPNKREETLAQRIEAEEKELMTGFWLPDLTQDEVCTKLIAWNGNWSSLSTMQFVRITKDGAKQLSTFPPKE
jgi:translation machinery-associated protein 16